MKTFLKTVMIIIMSVTAFARTASAQETTSEEQWVEVTLESAGTLGVEVLYKVDKLNDVINLRVHGPLNSSDWTSIKSMGNLANLDLSDASATSVPESQFSGWTWFKTILLPKNLTTIGSSAFYRTGLTELSIPANVRSIGQSMLRETSSLKAVIFEEGSQITTIPAYFCYNSKLSSINIPEGVTQIEQYAFRDCNNLADVSLPSTIYSIDKYSFLNCQSLINLILPESLKTLNDCAFQKTGLKKIHIPLKVSSIGSYCFSNCTSLEEVELPAYTLSLNPYVFENCTSLKRVICHTATPPTIKDYTTFYYVPTPDATLSVPSFAIVNYKLASYWMGFGSIEGGVTSDSWLINSDLTLSGDRRMEGTPDLYVDYGGKLTISGAPAQVFNSVQFDSYFINSGSYLATNPAQLINNCPAVSAYKLTTSYWNISSNLWYFITVPHQVKLSEITHSVQGAQFAFRYYDGESRATNGFGANWKNVPEDGTLEPGVGYIMMTDKSGHVDFSATPSGIKNYFSAQEVAIPVEAWASESAANAGWNYIGNPYPSFYDLYYTGLVCPVTLRTSSSSYTAYSLVDDNIVLYPHQSFFIQYTGTESAIPFPLKGRQFTTEVARAAAPAREHKASRSLFNLSLSADGNVDKTRVVINEDASESYEPTCDASKFFSEDPAMPQLWTVNADGDRLAINERPDDGSKVVLIVYAPAAGTYTISSSRCDGFVILHDALTGKSTTIDTENSYTFTTDNAGETGNRFSLSFAPSHSALDDIAADKDTVGNITFIGNTVSADVPFAVYFVDGRLVTTSEAGSIALNPGAYIVKAGSHTVKCLVK